MKKVVGVLTGVLVLTGLGIFVIRKINTRRRLDQVASDGYETAHDVLFPNKKIRSRKLRYGPVHPKMN